MSNDMKKKYPIRPQTRVCKDCGDVKQVKVAPSAIPDYCLKCQWKRARAISVEKHRGSGYSRPCSHCSKPVFYNKAALDRLKETFCCKKCRYDHTHRSFECRMCHTSYMIQRCKAYGSNDVPKWADEKGRRQQFCSIGCFADWRRLRIDAGTQMEFRK